MAQLHLIANWKMNMLHQDTEEFVDALEELQLPKGVRLVICPPFTSLCQLQASLWDTDIGAAIGIGAQNCAATLAGAYTGEVSAQMLHDFDVSHVLVGHSERRTLFQEDDTVVATKLKLIIEQGMVPVLCIGETMEERDSGATEEVLAKQILAALPKEFPETGVIIAYEPVWAIGTGRTATPQQVREAMIFIRGELAKLYSKQEAEQVPLLYGGSVNMENMKELASCAIDGALVGGASLKASTFISLANLLAQGKGM